MEIKYKYGGGGGTGAVLQKELPSTGNCFTNDKFTIDKKSAVAFCGFLMYDEKKLINIRLGIMHS